MKSEASITGKRQVTIPKDIYTALGLSNTDKLVFEQNENNEMIIKKKEISTYDVCPICNREVLNEDTMVVREYQKYHITCWGIEDVTKKIKASNEIVANKLTKSQVETIEDVIVKKNETMLKMINEIRDNEAIISVPIKITFMEQKPGVIGKVEHFEKSKIFSCNRISEYTSSKISEIMEL